MMWEENFANPVQGRAGSGFIDPHGHHRKTRDGMTNGLIHSDLSEDQAKAILSNTRIRFVLPVDDDGTRLAPCKGGGE